MIRIPLKLILNVMLEELGLHEAEYHLEMCEDGEFRVTVRFRTSAVPLEGSSVYLSITGVKSSSYEVAEDTACEQAIRNIEAATNTIVKDLGYQRMVLANWTIRCLCHKLHEEHLYKMKLARGWLLVVKHMSSFSKQVLSITYLNRSAVQDHITTIWNNLLNNFEGLGFRLRREGAKLERRLEKMKQEHYGSRYVVVDMK